MPLSLSAFLNIFIIHVYNPLPFLFFFLTYLSPTIYARAKSPLAASERCLENARITQTRTAIYAPHHHHQQQQIVYQQNIEP